MRTSNTPKKYVGYYNDIDGGMTDSGKVIRDAWIFDIIPETETCEGWTIGGLQDLWDKTSKEWDKYGMMVSNLPPEIRERFDRIQAKAIEHAKTSGWSADDDM
jgi:hypothetical protein